MKSQAKYATRIQEKRTDTMDKKKNSKSGKIKKILRSAAKESQKIKWCSMKEMVKSGVTVIIVGSAAAVLLTLFDI